MSNLTQIANSVRALLVDPWAQTLSPLALEESIQQALREIHPVNPRSTVSTITLSSSSREIDISTLTQPANPLEIWLPYTAADATLPPTPRAFRVLTPTLIYITDGNPPANGDIARVFYQTQHTIEGVAEAASTTLDEVAIGAITYGAAATLINARIRQIAEQVKTDPLATKTLEALHNDYRSRMGRYLLDTNRIPSGGFVSWANR